RLAPALELAAEALDLVRQHEDRAAGGARLLVAALLAQALAPASQLRHLRAIHGSKYEPACAKRRAPPPRPYDGRVPGVRLLVAVLVALVLAWLVASAVLFVWPDAD